jgi:hypothetical protein
MAALIIAIFPQNSSRGNWEEQQDRTDPNSQFELARKPAWLLAFRQFGLPKWKHDFECSSLQPLRYASMHKYSLFRTNHMISSAAPSTTRTTLRVYFRPVFFPEICSKTRWRENRRDGKKYSILRFSVLRNIKENQGDEIPSFCRNFESGPL